MPRQIGEDPHACSCACWPITEWSIFRAHTKATHPRSTRRKQCHWVLVNKSLLYFATHLMNKISAKSNRVCLRVTFRSTETYRTRKKCTIEITAEIIYDKSTGCVLYRFGINLALSLSSVSQFYKNLNFTAVLAIPIDFLKCWSCTIRSPGQEDKVM